MTKNGLIKTPDELALMRISGRLLASVFEMLDRQDLAGMSTLAVNDLVEHFITVDLAARPASKGQYGYGYVLNCSRNEVVCHGVPSADEIIRDGDIINLDITLEKNGFIADSSKTYLVGDTSPAARRLVRVAQEALTNAVRHGAPQRITLTLSGSPTAVVLEIADDGRGFDVTERPHRLKGAAGAVQEGVFVLGLQLASVQWGTAIAAEAGASAELGARTLADADRIAAAVLGPAPAEEAPDSTEEALRPVVAWEEIRRHSIVEDCRLPAPPVERMWICTVFGRSACS